MSFRLCRNIYHRPNIYSFSEKCLQALTTLSVGRTVFSPFDKLFSLDSGRLVLIQEANCILLSKTLTLLVRKLIHLDVARTNGTNDLDMPHVVIKIH